MTVSKQRPIPNLAIVPPSKLLGITDLDISDMLEGYKGRPPQFLSTAPPQTDLQKIVDSWFDLEDISAVCRKHGLKTSKLMKILNDLGLI